MKPLVLSMIRRLLVPSLLLAVSAISVQSYSQSAGQTKPTPSAAAAPTAVPALVPYSGTAPSSDGKLLTGEMSVTFLIFKDEQGGDPLWVETQMVGVDPAGRYAVQLGASSAAGLPANTFATGEGRWLEVQIAGQAPLPRVFLPSVPYAMKSADAEALSGHAAADFVTQDQFAQFAALSAHANSADSPTPLTASTITGSGKSGTIPLWTGTETQGDSEMVQGSNGIGIGVTTPATKLDVGGGATIRGTLALPATAAATKTASSNSDLLTMAASSWSSTTSVPVTQTFALRTTATGNDSSAPSSNLALLFGSGSNAPAATGLSIAPSGKITFASGQTFPGTGTGTLTGITTTSPLTGSGTTGSIALGLNQSALVTDIKSAMATALEPTYNSLYVPLTGNSTISGYLRASTGNQFAASLGLGTNGSIGVFGSSDTGIAVEANSTKPADGQAAMGAHINTTYSKTDQTFAASAGNAVAGVWGDASGNPNGTIAHNYFSAGMIGTADDGYGGIFINNSPSGLSALFSGSIGAGAALIANSAGSGDGILTYAASGDAIYANSNTGAGLYAQSTSGDGVIGLSMPNSGSTSGHGVYGQSGNPAAGFAGVIGVAHADSSTYEYLLEADFTAAVWGDAGNYNEGVGVIGTADYDAAGYFENNSPDNATLILENSGSGGTSNFSTLMASTPDGICGFGSGGTMTCTGQVKTLATIGGGAHKVETYATQAAENWMEDYGTGAIDKGVAVVKIDAAFSETISQTADYHVFLTPNADSKGLYVIKKTATSFEVRESGGGTSSLTFDYKIVAKRRGYESQRLVDVTDRFNAEQARSLIARTQGAHRAAAAHPHVIPQHKINPQIVRMLAARSNPSTSVQQLPSSHSTPSSTPQP